MDSAAFAELSDEKHWRERKQDKIDCDFRLSNGTSHPGKIKLRGWSSLRHGLAKGRARPNFRVRMSKPIRLSPGVKLKTVYLMNLAFDPQFFEMDWAYRVLRELGLFVPHSELVALKVNGRPLGVYLLVEQPESAIRRSYEGVTNVVRRVSRKDKLRYETKYSEGEDWAAEELGAWLKQSKGPELYRKLDRWCDLEQYFAWHTFNSLARNADSYDELFLFRSKPIVDSSVRIGFMPWDYDDLGAAKPAHVRAALDDPLMFAAEGRMAKAVQANVQLYGRLTNVMRGLLEGILTVDYLQKTLTASRLDGERIATHAEFPDVEGIVRRRRSAIDAFELKLIKRHRELLGRIRQH